VKTKPSAYLIPNAFVVLALLAWAGPLQSFADNSDSKELSKAASWKWSSGQVWLERFLGWIESTGTGDSKVPARESANRLADFRGIELHEAD
jgi:hypothetical protein